MTVTQEQLTQQKQEYDKQTAAIIATEGARLVDDVLSSITAADADADGYVDMVAWKGRQAATSYYNAPGSMDTLNSAYLTWVTKEEQMQAMVRLLHLDRLRGQRLALRLEQLLGLPPSGDTTKVFMSLRVKAADLFRPCRDPEINDCACMRSFPLGAYSDEASYKPVYESIVKSTQGFPWTRMGYTYDWNVKSRTHFGMSEYVIRQGAIVEVVSKVPTELWLLGKIDNGGR